MERDERLLVPTLLGLTLCTGIVDAVSFLGLGHVFTSNTTGALVIMGFAIAGAPGVSFWASAASIGAFIAGAVAAGFLFRLGERDDRRWFLTAFSIEAAMVAAAACVAIGFGADDPGARRYMLIAMLASAAGLRTATVRHSGIKDLPTTVITLGMAGLFSETALTGGDGERIPRRVFAILALLAGATLGAALALHNDLVVPLAVMAGIEAAVIGAYAYVSAPSRSRSTSPE